MRYLLYTALLFMTYCSCNNNKQSTPPTTTPENNPVKDSTSSPELKPELLPDSVSLFRFNLKDTIAWDLNGDGIKDKSFFKESGKEKNLLIVDGKTQSEIIVGKGPAFADIGTDFAWVDTWGITTDLVTYNNIIDDGEPIGTEKIKLSNPSIVVRTEVGGGVITFLNGNYRWVHQSD